MLDCWAVIQSILDRGQEESNRNTMKFNRDKCQLLPGRLCPGGDPTRASGQGNSSLEKAQDPVRQQDEQGLATRASNVLCEQDSSPESRGGQE